MPRVGPWALYGLLFTVVLVFALQGEAIISHLWDVSLWIARRWFATEPYQLVGGV